MRWSAASMTLALGAVVCSFVAPGSTDAATASVVNASVSHPAPCDGRLRAVGDGFCTHGGDLEPGVLPSRALRTVEVTSSSTADVCAGDGVSGPRVRVYYGYPSDTPENASTYRTWIRQSVAIADVNLDAQTPRADGQHLRMHCRNDRRVTVGSIALLPVGADNSFTFDDMIDSLTSRVENGLGSANIDTSRFTYVVFVDNVECCFGPAGQGTIYWDDRADPDRNFNNRVESGPRFAMVELGGSSTADAFVFLHEVGHTIGAVQASAPHSTGAGHCFTSVDVMCSFDGGPWFMGGGTMIPVCAQPPVGQFTFDCEAGDYYDIHPGPGSYLARHWNTADSRWLTQPA